jgi:hypothetical protein
VTRECRPCFHHGTRRRAYSRVLACACIGIVLKMRHRGVNLQQEAAADPSSVLFGTSHDHLPPYASSLAASLSVWKHRSCLATATHHRGISGCKLGSVVDSVVWTASRPETAKLSVAYPACRRIPSQDGERRGGCRESGVAEPRSPPPSNRTLVPRQKSWPLILGPPFVALHGPIGTTLRCRHFGSLGFPSLRRS